MYFSNFGQARGSRSEERSIGDKIDEFVERLCYDADKDYNPCSSPTNGVTYDSQARPTVQHAQANVAIEQGSTKKRQGYKSGTSCMKDVRNT